MKLDRDKIDIAMSKKRRTVAQLAKEYGVSRSRMNIILNSQTVTPATVGRLSDVLGVTVEEIIMS